MKNETMKANNLILGAIYINALSGQPCRLVNIVSCEGAWLESFDGSGYGVTVPFDAVHYASQDEVDDYLEDLHVYQASQKAPSHKELPVAQNYDRQWNVQGYYNDDNGNDIRCRD
tara:strand:+ start:240 stop:584 length:345 start_codon:yes stop_codon:yes gene_type:complete